MPVCFLNSAITGCIGTRYGDQIIPLTSAAPAALAAATVRSSMDAARASGMVPGMRFATVNPTPPSMKLRREMFDLVMVFLPPVFSFGCAQWALPPTTAAACVTSSKNSRCRPIVELTVGWRVAIRNTIRLRRTIGHAAVEITRNGRRRSNRMRSPPRRIALAIEKELRAQIAGHGGRAALRIDCGVPAQMTAKKLDGGIAAVDDKFAAGHKRSVIGGQEHDCGGDLFRACRPAQQRRSEQALGRRSILQDFLDHRCVCQGRMNRVNADAGLRDFARRGLGQ